MYFSKRSMFFKAIVNSSLAVMFKVPHLMTCASQTSALLLISLLACASIGGCSSRPAAAVSVKELAAIRANHASNTVGTSKQQVLDSYGDANKIKLGMSQIEGVDIEEWKIEAFRDSKDNRDLFITFLYFCDNKFVDSSDARIDFRNNAEMVKRWGALNK